MPAKIISYPWYSKVSEKEKLQQGDLIFKCQIVEPIAEEIEESQHIDVDIAEYDVIVMSQSCDLYTEKIDLVLVCPFYSLSDYGKYYPAYRSSDMKNNLRQGFVTGSHLLNKDDKNNIHDYLVVNFKSTYAVPIEFLKKIANNRGERIRLLPPYREHLSQSFARFFMRVGLPLDIPKFA